MNTHRLFLLLWSLVIGTSCESPSSKTTQRPRRDTRFPVVVQPVTERSIDYKITAVGSVEAFERIQIAARVSGTIERVFFREGDRVQAGQTLIQTDTERYNIAVNAAKAALQSAEVAQREADAGLARRLALSNNRPGLLPAEELDIWQAKAQLTAAQVAQAQASLAEALLNQKHAHLSAPQSGVIETRNVQTGQYVQPGVLLATLVRREPLLLRFKVNETEAAVLTSGMVVTFSVSGMPHDTKQARITHVSESAETASRMVSVTAEITDPSRQELRPGTFAQVSIKIGAKEDTIIIPEVAVRPTERGFVVYVIKDNVASERILTLGMRTEGDLIEVKGGLHANESIVVRGAEALAEGVAVRLIDSGQHESPFGQRSEPKAQKDEAPRKEGAL